MHILNKDDAPHKPGSPEDAAHDLIERDEHLKEVFKHLDTFSKLQTDEEKKSFVEHLASLMLPGAERSAENKAAGEPEEMLEKADGRTHFQKMEDRVRERYGMNKPKTDTPPFKTMEEKVRSRYGIPKLEDHTPKTVEGADLKDAGKLVKAGGHWRDTPGNKEESDKSGKPKDLAIPRPNTLDYAIMNAKKPIPEGPKMDYSEINKIKQAPVSEHTWDYSKMKNEKVDDRPNWKKKLDAQKMNKADEVAPEPEWKTKYQLPKIEGDDFGRFSPASSKVDYKQKMIKLVQSFKENKLEKNMEIGYQGVAGQDLMQAKGPM